MLPVQYTKFSQFAGLGVLGTSYILRGMCMCMYIIVTMYSRNTVYRTCGYLRVVDDVAKKSMQEAVDEVRALPEYAAKGEVSNFNDLFFDLYITKL